MTLKEYILKNDVTKEELESALKALDEKDKAAAKKDYEEAREAYIKAAADYLVAMNKYYGRKGKTREEYIKNLDHNTKTMPKYSCYCDVEPVYDATDRAFDEFFKAFGLK